MAHAMNGVDKETISDHESRILNLEVTGRFLDRDVSDVKNTLKKVCVDIESATKQIAVLNTTIRIWGTLIAVASASPIAFLVFERIFK